jgi:hypothetical protein
MKRRFSINLWVETEDLPIQSIRVAIERALRPISNRVSTTTIVPLARRTLMIMVAVDRSCAPFVAPKSAIIGAWYGGTEIEIYYEGAIHQQNMTFEEKCLHAADRFVTRYPTIARAILPANQLKQIGTYSFNDDGTERQVEITDSVSFMKWIGLPVPTED